MATARDIIIRPVISEKSMAGMREGKYTFVVDERASKTQIRNAIEEIFNVQVSKVNTLRMPGKWRRRGVHRGRTPNYKKALVTLKEGQTIKEFEGML